MVVACSSKRRKGDNLGPYAKDATSGATKTFFMDRLRDLITSSAMNMVNNDMLIALAELLRKASGYFALV